MKKSIANSLKHRDYGEHASSEELMRLHKSLFKVAKNSDHKIIGFPPGFEFKKVSVWDDTTSNYAVNTKTESTHA